MKGLLREIWRSAYADEQAAPPPPEPEQLARLLEADDSGDVEYLIAALTEPTLRRRAAWRLGKLKAPEAVTPLLRLMDARDSGVRSRAADALGSIGDRSAAVRLMEAAAEDEQPRVRAWAIDALRRLDDPAFDSALLPLLGDPSPSVRAAAATALAQHGEPRGIDMVDRIRRRETFTPRFLRLRRPTYPARPRTAVVLGAGWAAGTIAATTALEGGWRWAGEVLVIAVFRELWWRARERAARRRGIFAIDHGIRIGAGRDLAAVFAVLAVLYFGITVAWGPGLLGVFFLAYWVAQDGLERRLAAG